MKKTLLPLSVLLLCSCHAEQKEQTAADPFPRIEELDEKVSALQNRVTELERNTPQGQAQAADDARRAQLEALRAGENQVQESQNMLCDATGQC